jgi:LysR family transcriptional regulator, hydrogen peroxide-inducible genes activator
VITIRQLHYLDALARQEHFGRAAEQCSVSQPALSMQIHELEGILGVELIERRPGAPMFTELGIEIAERARAILGAVRDLTDFAQHRAKVLSGTLRLGLIPTLAPYILPRLLPQLERDYPDLRLDLVEAQTKALLADLERGTLEVLLLALPLKVAEFEVVNLVRDRFLLAVPADDPFPETARVRPNDVKKRKLILLEEGHCLRDHALDYCVKGRWNVASGLSATSLATVMQMVASGYGATLVPEVAVDVELRDDRVKLLRFVEPQPGRSIGLAWRRTSPRKADFLTLGQTVKSALMQPRGQNAVPVCERRSDVVFQEVVHSTLGCEHRSRQTKRLAEDRMDLPRNARLTPKG